MHQSVQTGAMCNIQQCWELLANNNASVCTELYINGTRKSKNLGYLGSKIGSKFSEENNTLQLGVFGGIQPIPFKKSTYQISIFVKMVISLITPTAHCSWSDKAHRSPRVIILKADLSYLSKCVQLFLKQILENKNLSQILA